MPLDFDRNTFGDNIIRGLSTEEVNVLRRLLHRMQQQVPTNHSTGSIQPTAQYTPYVLPTALAGCYIAQVPYGGIPAATYHGAGTGTGTGTGVMPSTHFSPGAAECQIFYHETRPSIGSGTSSGDDGQYVPADDVTHRVFNILDVSIPSGSFVPVIKDADGNWITALPQPARGIRRLLTRIDETFVTGPTAETTLYGDVIPAGTLANDGDMIVFSYSGTGVSVKDTGNVLLRFDILSSFLINFTDGTAGSAENYTWVIEGYIIRRSDTTVSIGFRSTWLNVGDAPDGARNNAWSAGSNAVTVPSLTNNDFNLGVNVLLTDTGTVFGASGFAELHPI